MVDRENLTNEELYSILRNEGVKKIFKEEDGRIILDYGKGNDSDLRSSDSCFTRLEAIHASLLDQKDRFDDRSISDELNKKIEQSRELFRIYEQLVLRVRAGSILLPKVFDLPNAKPEMELIEAARACLKTKREKRKQDNITDICADFLKDHQIRGKPDYTAPKLVNYIADRRRNSKL